MAFTIAIDTGPLKTQHKVRGVGEHTSELIEGLKKINSNEFDFNYVDFSKVDLNSYDLVHYQFFHPHRELLPKVFPRAKILVTIHDLIPLIYPDRYPSGLFGKLTFYGQKQRAKKADGIVTISEASKKDIVRFLRVDPATVSVVHLAASQKYSHIEDNVLQRVKNKFKLPNKFVLFVCDINYNKNVVSLVRACKELGVALVLVGKHVAEIEGMGLNLPRVEGPRDWIRFIFDIPHPELAHLRELLEEIESGKDIIRTGYVTEEEKYALYKLATLYCHPSFYEGFSIPVVEAMSSGTPVICSRTQALVEVAGNGALFFDARLQDDLTDKLKKVLASETILKKLKDAGLAQAKQYSWNKTARETFGVYEKILQGI